MKISFKNTISILIKRFFNVIELIVFLLIVILYLFRSYYVQSELVNQITTSINKEFDSNISINKVRLKGFKYLQISEIFIPDQYGDTIVFIPKINLDFNKVKLLANKYVIDQIVIEDASFKIRKRKGNEDYNYQYLFNNKKESNSSNLSLEVKSIELKNNTFSHLNDYYSFGHQSIGFQCFKLININCLFTNIGFSNDYLSADVEQLSLLEKSGFKINELNTNLIIDSTSMKFSNLNISTNNSTISVKDINCLMDDSFELDINSFKSELDLTDVNYFYNSPLLTSSKLKLNCDLKKEDDYLKADNLSLIVGDYSFINADLVISDSSDYDLRIYNSEIDIDDLISFKYIKADGKYQSIFIPDNLNKIDDVSLDLSLNGKLNNFNSNYTISSDYGNINGQLLINENQDSVITYDLKIKADKLAGELISEKLNVDYFNANLNIKGTGLESNDLDLIIDGSLSDLKYNNYIYEDVSINGSLKNQSFNGDISLSDKLIDLVFKGDLDLNKNPYEFDFTLNVNHAFLNDLGLVDNSLNPKISFNSKATGTGSSLDNFTGDIDFTEINYFENDNKYFFDFLNIYSFSNDKEHQVTLLSKFFTFDMVGNYHFDHFSNDLNSYLSIFIPNVFDSPSNMDHKEENIHIQAKINDVSLLSDLFFPHLRIANQSTIDLDFSKNKKYADLSISSNFIEYYGFLFNDIRVLSKNNNSFIDSIFNLSIELSDITDNNLVNCNNVNIITSVHNNQLELELNWDNKDSLNSGNFNMSAFFNSKDSIDLNLEKGVFKSKALGESKWSDNSVLTFHNNIISFDTMAIENKAQKLTIYGDVGPNKKDVFNIQAKEIRLNNLNSLYKDNESFLFSGVINAKIDLSALYGSTEFVSDVKINDVKINDYIIGDFKFNSLWNKINNRFDFRGGMLNESREEEIVLEECFFYPENDDSTQLYGSILFDHFNVDFLSPFLPNEVLSDLEGSLTGDINLGGNWFKPILKGELKINYSKISLSEFNTDINIDGLVKVSPNHIDIFGASISDQHNTKGKLSAYYEHDNFSSYSLNIVTEFEEPFLVMNNDYNDNPLYYGDAYITGFTNISYDSINGVSVNINAKTEDNTYLTIPLYGSEDVVMHDFISFRDTVKLIEESNSFENDISNFNLNIDLEITEDAEFELVFDEMVGDVIKSNGVGNIRLEIDKNYDLSMFGKYMINDGSYSFVLKDFLSKKFIIEQGGYITWYGDPYNANLNLYANYPLRASLYNIMPYMERENWTNKSEVNVKIHLLNDLMNPDVSFGIELPKSNQSAKTALESLVTNEEEMNKQVFSLLILNQFVPQNMDDYSDNSNKINGSSTTEALGNQLGNMISSFSDEFEIGFNYSPGDLITNNEVSLAMSTQQFNDRLKINTNLGVSKANELSRNPSTFIGDVDVEYKLNKAGNLRIHAFNESNEYDLANQNQSNYTQGVGALYKQSFNTGAELFCEIFNLFKPKGKKCEDCSDKNTRRKQSK